MSVAFYECSVLCVATVLFQGIIVKFFILTVSHRMFQKKLPYRKLMQLKIEIILNALKRRRGGGVNLWKAKVLKKERRVGINKKMCDD